MTLSVGKGGIEGDGSEDDEHFRVRGSALSEGVVVDSAALLLLDPVSALRVLAFRDFSSSLQRLFGQGLAHPH